jgi:hypothetical protein
MDSSGGNDYDSEVWMQEIVSILEKDNLVRDAYFAAGDDIIRLSVQSTIDRLTTIMKFRSLTKDENRELEQARNALLIIP